MLCCSLTPPNLRPQLKVHLAARSALMQPEARCSAEAGAFLPSVQRGAMGLQQGLP